MGSKLKLRGPRVVGELAVVFLGVLIALGVDAWWEGVQDRSQLNEYLVAVAVDLRSLEENLDGVIDRRDQLQEDLAEMVVLLASEEPISDTLVFPGLYTSNPFLPIGILDALLANANLEYLEPEVRGGLAKYRAAVEWHRSNLDRQSELLSTLVDAAIREADRLGALDADPQSRPSVSALRRSRESLGIVRAYYVRMDSGTSNLRDLRTSVRQLRSVLNARARGELAAS